MAGLASTLYDNSKEEYMANLTEPQRDRRNKIRRSAAVERAVNFFNTSVPSSRTDQCRYALKKIRASERPLRTAKAQAKRFRDASLPAEHEACPDLSAGQEARVSLIRRQHPALQGMAAYEDKLGSLERDLVTGKISQEKFDQKCQVIAEKKLPDRIRNYVPPAYPLPVAQSPIERIPSDSLHEALGLSRPEPGEIGPMPEFLDRCKGVPKE